MHIFKPTMYRRNIFEIDYKKLKDMGKTCLVFDLDNTLGLVDQKKCPDETKKLIKKLQKDFLVLISSNNNKKRLEPYLNELGIDGVAWSLKPMTRGLRKIKSEHKLEKDQMVMIGDQIVTDILAGNNYKVMTILVDPLGKKDLKITGLNRLIEKQIVNNYTKKGIFERGKYYE